MKKKILLVLKFAFFIGLGVFFIWWFQRKLTPDEKHEITNSFRSANYIWVFIAFIPGLLSHLSRAIRWRMLLKPMGYEPKLKTTFAAVMIGYFANLAFPRLGEVMRCGILNKYEKIPVSKSFGTVITERTVDMLIFFILFFLALVIEFQNLKDYVYNNFWIKFADKFNNFSFTDAFILFLFALIIIVFTVYFIFRKRIVASALYIKIMVFILGFVEGIKSLSKVEKPYLFVFHTLFIWLNYFLTVWVAFYCFEQTSSLGLSVVLSALVMGSIGIMLVPGGIGIYPVIISQTLMIFAIPKTVGYAMGWISWSSQTLLIIIIGLVSLVVLPLLKKKDDAKV
ncbi:MAG: lysylphosphatidylglycerol synthase transmembrane domain-containing protein [Bacteroidetes bacterium]|nr:lysylphosphatidylglycerol synthase transmembrane domain-containing protein [Bacteroidota bacterium]